MLDIVGGCPHPGDDYDPAVAKNILTLLPSLLICIIMLQRIPNKIKVVTHLNLLVK
tara:strand:+ start:1346 stop:1513 length:168 start_codon:yes stop_codon:yes gene_type:complete